MIFCCCNNSSNPNSALEVVNAAMVFKKEHDYYNVSRLIQGVLKMFYRVRTEQEIEQVINLAWCIWTEHYTPIIGAKQVEYMLNHFHSKAQIAQQINVDHYQYFLIKRDTKEIGYIGLKIEEDALFLSKIYILGSARGKGVGRATMEYIKNLAQKNNLRKISLTVNKYNSDTITAYSKFGFIKTGEICADIGGGYKMDDFQMELVF